MSDSDDDDLDYAIKLSLREAEAASAPKKPLPVNEPSKESKRQEIDLTSDDESRSPKRRKFSKSGPVSITQDSQNNPTSISQDSHAEPNKSSGTGGLLGLDRAQMERERLARINNQRVSPPPLKRTGKPPSLSGKAVQTGETTLQYPNGVLKKTWAFGYPRDGGDIKIEEVLQRKKLNIAVLSSFQWDPEWIFSKIDLERTKLIMVMQAKEDSEKVEARLQASKLPNCRVCFPYMGGQVNCMHSKLQLLFYDDSLRVVVPSANLTTHDWGESGILENAVFLIDLPRLPSTATPQTEKDLTFFGQELLRFIKAKGLEADVIEGVLKFDFEKTQDMAFIHTIGGANGGLNYGDKWKYTGYCGLSTAVRKLNLQTDSPIDIDFVISSVGSLTIPFVKTLYDAAKGINPLVEYAGRYDKPEKKSKSGTSTTPAEEREKNEIESHFRAYFPSSQTVKDSNKGVNAGGTLFLSSSSWNKEGFPRSIFRDCKSVRPGMLMHNKMLFVRSSEILGSTDAANPRNAWVYHGSANLSESAWGRLVKDVKSKSPKLNCRNWECGVLLPASGKPSLGSESSPKGDGSNAIPSMEIFKNVINPPMDIPGEPLLDDNKTPWYLQEPHLW